MDPYQYHSIYMFRSCCLIDPQLCIWFRGNADTVQLGCRYHVVEGVVADDADAHHDGHACGEVAVFVPAVAPMPASPPRTTVTLTLAHVFV